MTLKHLIISTKTASNHIIYNTYNSNNHSSIAKNNFNSKYITSGVDEVIEWSSLMLNAPHDSITLRCNHELFSSQQSHFRQFYRLNHICNHLSMKHTDFNSLVVNDLTISWANTHSFVSSSGCNNSHSGHSQ